MKISKALSFPTLWVLLGGLALAADELDVQAQERLRDTILDDARISS